MSFVLEECGKNAKGRYGVLRNFSVARMFVRVGVAIVDVAAAAVAVNARDAKVTQCLRFGVYADVDCSGAIGLNSNYEQKMGCLNRHS